MAFIDHMISDKLFNLRNERCLLCDNFFSNGFDFTSRFRLTLDNHIAYMCIYHGNQTVMYQMYQMISTASRYYIYGWHCPHQITIAPLLQKVLLCSQNKSKLKKPGQQHLVSELRTSPGTYDR